MHWEVLSSYLVHILLQLVWADTFTYAASGTFFCTRAIRTVEASLHQRYLSLHWERLMQLLRANRKMQE